jgi:rhodanese-related sulfurtransferase
MATLLKPGDTHSDDIQWIIDVRTPDEFVREHIPGTTNIPLDVISSQAEPLKTRERIILSCRSGARAAEAASRLEAVGVHSIQLLEGGINGWKAAGRETVSQKKGFSIMQQVQIIVGLMVLTGALYPPLWFLALIAGCGMLIAGLTNTCMMAVFLSKMPWNRNSSPTCSI